MAQRTEILFEYTEGNFIYRGVRAAYNAGYRVEKKKVTSKKFTPFVWSGDAKGLDAYREKARAAKGMQS